LLKKKTIFVNLKKKKSKFLAIFLHSNGNFPESQVDSKVRLIVSRRLDLMAPGSNTRTVTN